MPLTSPGNDDDTGENHQPTLRKNTAEPVEQTLKQNTLEFQRNFAICIDAVMEMIAPFWNLIERTSALVGIGVHWRWAIYIAAATLLVEDTLRIMRRP